jgi:pyrroline-5-carboxylate reductase
MGEALLAGLLDGGWAPASELRVVEAIEDRRAELADRYPDVEVTEAPGPAEGTVIAVKPPDVAAACAPLQETSRVLSIAAGVRLADLEAALPAGTPVVRAMPNTPALVGSGAAAIAAGSSAGNEDLDWAEGILAAVGTVVRLDESLLDAVTGLSGSGPAYVFLLAEALIEAGTQVGLPREVARDLTVQTVLGAGRLLAEGEAQPEELRAMVTSPGGTTQAAIEVLEAAGVRHAFLDAVRAATERSKQLGSA